MIASNSTTPSGLPNFNRSDWIMSPAADIIFSAARRRCFISERYKSLKATHTDQDEEWDIIDEMSGQTSNKPKRPDWLPQNITPVLEEPPKWEYLVETLLEIEDLIRNYPAPVGAYMFFIFIYYLNP